MTSSEQRFLALYGTHELCCVVRPYGFTSAELRREERHDELTAARLVLLETWVQSGKQWSGVRLFERVK